MALDGGDIEEGKDAKEDQSDQGKDKEGGGEREPQFCYVCDDGPRDSVLQPCGHGGMCYDCAVTLARTRSASNNEPPRCPLCRTNVTQVFQLNGQGAGGSDSSFHAARSWLVGEQA